MAHHSFDKNTLKDVIFCAVLMSSIDGEVHQKEWEIIKLFAAQYWKEEYGEFESFHLETTKKINSLIAGKENLPPKINSLVERLLSRLNSNQKQVVLNLVGEVMIADGIMTLDESKLFETFMGKLGIRIG